MSKNNLERDSPAKPSPIQENEELGDSDDRPESEENLNDIIVEKFKVLETDPSDRNNTPETKASKERKTNDSSERPKSEEKFKTEEPADKIRQDENDKIK